MTTTAEDKVTAVAAAKTGKIVAPAMVKQEKKVAELKAKADIEKAETKGKEAAQAAAESTVTEKPKGLEQDHSVTSTSVSTSGSTLVSTSTPTSASISTSTKAKTQQTAVKAAKRDAYTTTAERTEKTSRTKAVAYEKLNQARVEAINAQQAVYDERAAQAKGCLANILQRATSNETTVQQEVLQLQPVQSSKPSFVSCPFCGPKDNAIGQYTKQMEKGLSSFTCSALPKGFAAQQATCTTKGGYYLAFSSDDGKCVAYDQSNPGDPPANDIVVAEKGRMMMAQSWVDRSRTHEILSGNHRLKAYAVCSQSAQVVCIPGKDSGLSRKCLFDGIAQCREVITSKESCELSFGRIEKREWEREPVCVYSDCKVPTKWTTADHFGIQRTSWCMKVAQDVPSLLSKCASPKQKTAHARLDDLTWNELDSHAQDLGESSQTTLTGGVRSSMLHFTLCSYHTKPMSQHHLSGILYYAANLSHC